MKIVKVQVLPAHDNEVVSAVIIEERRKDNKWEETSKSTVMTDTPNASRTILLDDDDRVIIEGRVEAEAVVDREQFSAKRVWKGDKAEVEDKKNKEEAKRFEKMEKEDKETLKKDKPLEYKALYGEAERKEEERKKAEGAVDPKSGAKTGEGAAGQSGSEGKADREAKSAIGPASSEDVKQDSTPASYKAKR